MSYNASTNWGIFYNNSSIGTANGGLGLTLGQIQNSFGLTSMPSPDDNLWYYFDLNSTSAPIAVDATSNSSLLLSFNFPGPVPSFETFGGTLLALGPTCIIGTLSTGTINAGSIQSWRDNSNNIVTFLDSDVNSQVVFYRSANGLRWAISEGGSETSTSGAEAHTVPCLSLQSILSIQLPEDILIQKKNKQNTSWVYINKDSTTSPLYLTYDHLVKDNESDSPVKAESYTDKRFDTVDGHDVVDLVTSDGRFVEIKGLLIKTSKF